MVVGVVVEPAHVTKRKIIPVRGARQDAFRQIFNTGQCA
jgi:hypothetical protein